MWDFLEPEIDKEKKSSTAFRRRNFCVYLMFFEYFEKFHNIRSNTNVNLKESKSRFMNYDDSFDSYQ